MIVVVRSLHWLLFQHPARRGKHKLTVPKRPKLQIHQRRHPLTRNKPLRGRALGHSGWVSLQSAVCLWSP